MIKDENLRMEYYCRNTSIMLYLTIIPQGLMKGTGNCVWQRTRTSCTDGVQGGGTLGLVYARVATLGTLRPFNSSALGTPKYAGSGEVGSHRNLLELLDSQRRAVRCKSIVCFDDS